MTLGEQVKAARIKMELSQDELKNKAGISLDTLRRIEKNRNSNPTLFVLTQLQKILDVKFNI